MTVWFVWNTLSFVVVLCYFISEALIFFTASVFWLYSEAVVKVMQPKSATERYVERSEPIRVSGSHDVDFTHNTPHPAPRTPTPRFRNNRPWSLYRRRKSDNCRSLREIGMLKKSFHSERVKGEVTKEKRIFRFTGKLLSQVFKRSNLF